MNRPVKEDCRLYCPQCGYELRWDDTVDRGDIAPDGVPEDDYTTIDYWHCPNCGANIEIWQALESEKCLYPFWNNENDN